MNRVLSVSELNRLAAKRLKEDPILGRTQVRGEISEFKYSPRGHLYMTIKDDLASLSAVMFKSDLLRQDVKLQRGIEVTLSGGCSLYEADGRFQFIAREISLEGEGALHQNFLALKEKLEREGLFAPERKRPLPRFPARVALITSPTGAVQRDFITTAEKLHAPFDILLIPALVQGELAPASLIQALELAACRPEIDVIVLARGGGSFSDLNAFNDEALARAIARCPKIVVSAIGHETDFTIADFVSDWRSATPTAAAKDIYPDWTALIQRIDLLESRLLRVQSQRIQSSRSELLHRQQSLHHAMERSWREQRRRLQEARLRLRSQNQAELRSLQGQRQSFALGHLRSIVERHLTAARQSQRQSERDLKRAYDNFMTSATESWTELLRGLELSMTQVWGREVNKFKLIDMRLQGLSPKKILERGYAIARDASGEALLDPESLQDGSSFHLVLAKGELLAEKLKTLGEEKGQKNG